MIELKCSKCKSSLVNKGSYVKHINSCILDINTKINIKNDYLVYGLSIRKLALKYNTDKSIFYRYVLLSKLFRNSSDAAKLARKKYPENFKHSDESKNKMREARLKWMMENPEKTAWRNFFYQMLIGDGTDNIPGCGEKIEMLWGGKLVLRRQGVGKKAALNLLSKIEDKNTLFHVVRMEYVKRFDELYEEKMLENARLLFVGQREDDLFDFSWLDKVWD